MTKMLASVRDRQEAETALKGGADIIDLTSAEGTALALKTIRDTVKLIAGARTVSALCGDLDQAEEIAAAGVDYIRSGFLPSKRLIADVKALAGLAASTKLIGVLYAEHVYPDDLPAAFAAAGFHGIMLDTISAGRLLDHISLDRIGSFIEAAHGYSMIAGVAGGLEAPDIPRLLVYNTDFLGFSGLDAAGMAKIRALIPEKQKRAPKRKVSEPEDADLGTDKIFVRDFVLPVHIGAYSFEHGKPQKVRFDVTADVRRVTNAPREMRHVVSYDLIMDGIRGIVARGHVELSETLAEEIATLILAHPRVMRVVVRVEKLELGPGGVGVEIERRVGKRDRIF
ncbi:(5-formylfuran-3-yl)methyl phosphate synthase [Phyllobacterium leguminum]|uniref:(5-formylfuran-3-yl)methyl phosphate synthase n=1 Tax=Phyllobacterium leguminum TaxID=314237 RepID=A0A318TKH0_9HYPH|nr:(5-formylfuran-3-yl)methyl phosphate synthase [Phyllobacterium leguminum]PYE89927.1 dihydroneopterin aldolase [Phyllobacterium leguminum]